MWPEFAFAVRASRAFLGRVVRYLAADARIRQFLDLGTGIPTAGNIHQVAQAIASQTRVVYVDYDDPVVLAHARALLTSHESGATEYIDADLRDTSTIFTRAAGLLDFTKPVAVTISHAGSDLFSQEAAENFKGVLDRMIQQQYTPRNHEQVARFFAGMDLVEPGLIPVEEWHPEHGDTGGAGKLAVLGAVGRKR